MIKLKRVTHAQLMKACARHNLEKGLAYGQQGYLQWADIFGSGNYTPRLWVKGPESRGLSAIETNLTTRQTLAYIEKQTHGESFANKES